MAGVTNKVSLRLKEKGKPFFTFGLLRPLSELGGVEFPYTPTIQMNYSANYGTFDTTHSVYQQQYYVNTPNPTISLTAQFTAQTEAEARYTAAALHFFKSCTKSDFGEQAGERAGTPPPILIFNAYGSANAKNVPVVIRSASWTLTEDSDYVEIEMDGTEFGGSDKISVPTAVLVSLELAVQIPPKKVRKDFNIRGYASGTLLKGGGFM